MRPKPMADATTSPPLASTSKASETIRIQAVPLTVEAFRPFGQVGVCMR